MYILMITWVPKKKINQERVNELLAISIESNQFTNGSPVVALLEQRIRTVCKIDESKTIICVSNGTVALWAAVAAIELYQNKDLQMYTQSFTFPGGDMQLIKYIQHEVNKDPSKKSVFIPLLLCYHDTEGETKR